MLGRLRAEHDGGTGDTEHDGGTGDAENDGDLGGAGTPGLGGTCWAGRSLPVRPRRAPFAPAGGPTVRERAGRHGLDRWGSDDAAGGSSDAGDAEPAGGRRVDAGGSTADGGSDGEEIGGDLGWREALGDAMADDGDGGSVATPTAPAPRPRAALRVGYTRTTPTSSRRHHSSRSTTRTS